MRTAIALLAFGRRLVAVALVIASASAITVAVGAATRLEFNVRNYGAVGDGVTNDTAAIQRANDYAATVGGRVVFPAGTYVAGGVTQDSGVEFAGSPGAVLKHPNGIDPKFVIKTRTSATTASITKGSPVLQVASTYRMKPGARIAVRGAGGPSDVQTTTISSNIDASTVAIPVADTGGFPAAAVLQIGDEAIVYYAKTSNGFAQITRGVWGTQPQAHTAGERISMITYLYATIASVAGTSVTLDRPAAFGVRSVQVTVGSSDVSIRDLTIDVNNPRNGIYVTNTVGVRFTTTTRASITGSVIRNGIHGAVSLELGTTESTVEGNTFSDNGRPFERLGAGVWLFRGASGNTIRNNAIDGSGFWGIAVDDRTETVDEMDAPSNGNLIEGNTIDMPARVLTVGIYVIGSNDNIVRNNTVRNIETGIQVVKSEQGLHELNAQHNEVSTNTLSGHYRGIRLTGDNNTVTANVISETQDPIVDLGTGNVVQGDVAVLRPQPTSTMVTTTPGVVAYGDSTRTTARVLGFGTKTGDVRFTVDGEPVGAAVPLDANGDAVLELGTLRAGEHTIAASYSGDIAHLSSAGEWTMTVAQAASAISLTHGLFSPYGDIVRVVAEVAGTGRPSGAVQFSVDGANVGSPQIVGDDGRTAVDLPVLTLGEHEVSAVYSGDADHVGSSAIAVQNVGKASTVVTATAGSVPTARLTQVRGAVPLVGRTMRFLVRGVVVCTALTDPGGRASCPGGWSKLASRAGGYVVAFTGDDINLPSATTVALTSSKLVRSVSPYLSPFTADVRRSL